MGQVRAGRRQTPPRGVSMLALVMALVLWADPTFARCRADASLEIKQAVIARRDFPELVANLPDILGCDDELDMPGALGNFSRSEWRVRILLRPSSTPLEVVIAHELGHALADKNGEVYGRFKGHGAMWLRTMILAGQGEEAARTASMTQDFPGLWAVYQRVAKQVSRGADFDLDLVALLKQRPAWLDALTKPID